MTVAARKQFTIDEYHQLIELGFLPYQAISIPGFEDVFLGFTRIFPGAIAI
jgi:hypothetical protein